MVGSGHKIRHGLHLMKSGMKNLYMVWIVAAILLLSSTSLFGSSWDSLCDSIAGALGNCHDGTLTREDIEDAYLEGRLTSLTPEQAENFGELCEMAGRASLRGLTRPEIIRFFGGLCRESFRWRDSSTEL